MWLRWFSQASMSGKAHLNVLVDSALIYHNDIITLGPFSHFPSIPFEAKGYSWGKGVIQVVDKRIRMPCFEADRKSFQMYYRRLLWLCALSVHQHQIQSTRQNSRGLSLPILLELAAGNTAFDYMLTKQVLTLLCLPSVTVLRIFTDMVTFHPYISMFTASVRIVFLF